MSTETQPDIIPMPPDDGRFIAFFREVSGCGEALQIDVNQAALNQAAEDIGLGEGRITGINFAAGQNFARVEMTSYDQTAFSEFVYKSDPALRTIGGAQQILQYAILDCLVGLQVSHKTAGNPRLFKKKMRKLPLALKLDRLASVTVAALGGVVGSHVVLEVLAQTSPNPVKNASIAIATLAIGGRINRVSADENSRYLFSKAGEVYPPFIEFNVDPPQN